MFNSVVHLFEMRLIALALLTWVLQKALAFDPALLLDLALAFDPALLIDLALAFDPALLIGLALV